MLDKLPPRERQIVDILYSGGEATVAEVCAALPDPLSDSAVRAMLTRLEAKGFVARHQSPKGFVYAPAVPSRQGRSPTITATAASSGRRTAASGSRSRHAGGSSAIRP